VINHHERGNGGTVYYSSFIQPMAKEI